MDKYQAIFHPTELAAKWGEEEGSFTVLSIRSRHEPEGCDNGTDQGCNQNEANDVYQYFEPIHVGYHSLAFSGTTGVRDAD